MAKSNATSLTIELPDASPVVPEPRVYAPPPTPAKDPWVRYAGVEPSHSPSLQHPSSVLLRLERWYGEVLRREGGDKPNEHWASDGYSLKEAQLVAAKLAERLAQAMSKAYGEQ